MRRRVRGEVNHGASKGLHADKGLRGTARSNRLWMGVATPHTQYIIMNGSSHCTKITLKSASCNEAGLARVGRSKWSEDVKGRDENSPDAAKREQVRVRNGWGIAQEKSADVRRLR